MSAPVPLPPPWPKAVHLTAPRHAASGSALRRWCNRLPFIVSWLAVAVAPGMAAAQSVRQPAPPGRIELAPVEFAQLLTLRNLELTFGRETVEVSRALAQAEAALYEPLLFGNTKINSIERQRTIEEKTSNFAAATQNVLDEEGKTFEVGVRQRLPSGGELSLSARTVTRSSNVLAKAGTDSEVNSGLVLLIKQPLMRGRGVGVTETDRRVAEIEWVIAQWQFRQQLQKVIAESMSVFWQAHAASDVLSLREALVANAEALVRDAQERVAAGRLPPRAVSEAQRLRLVRQSELSRARQARDELLIKLMTSIDLPHARLADLSLRAKPLADVDSAVDVGEALSQWAPYRIAGLRHLQGQVRLNFALNQQRPAVDLVLSHSQSGLSESTTTSLSTVRRGRYPEWFVGLNVELGAGGNAKARLQAQAQQWRVTQSETERTAIEQAFRNDFQSKKDALQSVLAELRLIEDDAALRATFLAQEKARVTLGGTTMASQVQAEQDLLEVQVRLAEAAGRREVARLSLMLAEGQLLRLHGVETPLPTEP